ncbi:ankyrin repeat-containing domain protein [Aspergillus californicus]
MPTRVLIGKIKREREREKQDHEAIERAWSREAEFERYQEYIKTKRTGDEEKRANLQHTANPRLAEPRECEGDEYSECRDTKTQHREQRHSIIEPSIPFQPTPNADNETSELETKLPIPNDASSGDFTGRTPLSWAAAAGNEAAVKRLLEEGADIESSDKIYGWTPLLWAVSGGHEKVVELLLARSASTTAKGTNDQVPLSIAAWHGYGAIVAILLSNGVDVNSADKDGRTALSWAMKNGHGDVVGLLLVAGGTSLELTDDYGRVPLSWWIKEYEKEDERGSEIINHEGSKSSGKHSMDYDSLSSLSAATHTAEGSVASMTSDDEAEGYDTASDTGTIDEGPCDNSDELSTDTRLTKPHGWLERLSLLEQEVIEASSTYRGYVPLFLRPIICTFGTTARKALLIDGLFPSV